MGSNPTSSAICLGCGNRVTDGDNTLYGSTLFCSVKCIDFHVRQMNFINHWAHLHNLREIVKWFKTWGS